jgi:hypothetical protein
LGFPIAAGAAVDLLDRDPLDEVHPADLRPLLHPDQLLLLASACRTEPGSVPRRTAPLGAEGVSFNRRRVRSIQAAPTRRHGFERIDSGNLVDTYMRSRFEDTRRTALNFGAHGTTVRLTSRQAVRCRRVAA